MAKAPAKKSQTLPATMDMEEESQGHEQKFARDQLITPRIKILQDLSPEVKERNAAYIEGARPGLMCNEVLGVLCREIEFVPAKFFVRYIAWQPRSAGGGLVNPNLTREDCDQFEDVGIGSWTGMMVPAKGKDPVRVEIAETPEWVGIAKGFGLEDGVEWGPMPCAISFPSTKAKHARKINSVISLTEREGKNGPFTPAAFFHKFTLSTALETSGDDEWFGYHVQHVGVGVDPDMSARAKNLKIAFDEDRATVDDSNLDR